MELQSYYIKDILKRVKRHIVCERSENQYFVNITQYLCSKNGDKHQNPNNAFFFNT